jgi:hypothetical protein
MLAPETLLMFLLYMTTLEDSDQEEVDEILNAFQRHNSLGDFSKKILEFIKIKRVRPRELSVYDNAKAAYNEKKFDLAFRLVQNCPINNESIALAIICAREINTVESANSVIDMYSLADSDTKSFVQSNQQLSKKYNFILREYIENEETKEANSINNWQQWLEKLNREKRWGKATQFADRAVSEWNIEDYKKDLDLIDIIVDLIPRVAEGETKKIFYSSLPDFIEFFKYRDDSYSLFKDIYLKIIDVLIYNGQYLSSEVSAIAELADSILKIGLTKHEYTELIKNISDYWQVIKAPQHYDWALDMLDMFMYYNCPDDKARESFFITIVNSFIDKYNRIDNEQFEFLSILVKEYKQEPMFEHLRRLVQKDEKIISERDKEIAQKLKGKIIAIYTLSEQAAKRACELIKGKYSDIDVRINNDYAASEKLKSLARNAFIFLFCSKSAKHPAFACIQSNISKEANFTQIEGKGSTSIFRGFMKTVEELS